MRVFSVSVGTEEVVVGVPAWGAVGGAEGGIVLGVKSADPSPPLSVVGSCINSSWLPGMRVVGASLTAARGKGLFAPLASPAALVPPPARYRTPAVGCPRC